MIISFNRYNGGGSGSGVTPEQVQEQIDSALTSYWESGETKDYVDGAVSGISLEGYYTSAQTDNAIAQAVSGLATEQYVQDALSGVNLDNYWTSAQTHDAISAATSGKADAVNIQPNHGNYRLPSWNEQGIVTGALGNAYTNSITINGVSKSYWGRGNGNPDPFYAPVSPGSAGDILVSTGNGAPVWSAVTFPDVSNYVTSAQVETQIEAKNYVVSGEVEDQIVAKNYVTSAQTKTYVDSAITIVQDQIDTMDDVVSAALVDLNDTKVGSADVKHIVKLTQAEYDALTDKDPYTFYIIISNS